MYPREASCIAHYCKTQIMIAATTHQRLLCSYVALLTSVAWMTCAQESLCRDTDLSDAFEWRYYPKKTKSYHLFTKVTFEEENGSYAKCPSTIGFAKSHQLGYQTSVYINGAYTKAVLETNKCRLMNITESTNVISSYYSKIRKASEPRPVLISVVGDSLQGQLAIAMHCWMEQLSLLSSKRYKVDFAHDHTLRNDVPCSSKCTDPVFRAGTNVFCTRCRKDEYGKNTGLQELFKAQSDILGLNIIDSNHTDILVLGSGTWYNNIKMAEGNVTAMYIDTLVLLVPILQELIHKGVVVVWEAMPPIDNGESARHPEYGWTQFGAMNNLAKGYFEAIGVLFFDMNRVISKRMDGPHHRSHGQLRDFSIFNNRGVHYTSPGESSMTTTLVTSLLHFVALQLTENGHY